MGLDPTLSAFQTSRFNKKVFIVDTDVALEALVGDDPRSLGLRALLEGLARMGCRLIIPNSIIDECILHASASPRTYNFFGDTLLQLSPALVEERVWNAFVKGYYYARIAERIPSTVTYENYLSNFYEPRNPRKFLAAVIEEVLPEEIEILPLQEIPPEGLHPAEIEKFAERLKQDLAGSKKSRYRTDADEDRLARTDAELFLTALHMNPRDENTKNDVLGGTCYLITETSRYTRVAHALNVHTSVTVRPGALVSMQDLIGGFELSPTDFLQLFDNPFLNSAVDAVWPDLEKLIRTGVTLRGKSLPRLRFDLDQVLHEHLTALTEAEEAEEKDGFKGTSADEEFVDLLEAANRRGYSLIPEVEAVRARIQTSEQRTGKLEALLDEATNKNRHLEEQIDFFGKRRQRYLKRFNRRGRK